MPTLLHHCTIPYNQCPVWWLLDEYTPTPNTLNPFCPLYICWTDIFYPMLPSVCTIQDFRLLSHLPLVIQINIQSLSVSIGDRPNVKQRHHHETSLLQNVALMTAGWKNSWFLTSFLHHVFSCPECLSFSVSIIIASSSRNHAFHNFCFKPTWYSIRPK